MCDSFNPISVRVESYFVLFECRAEHSNVIFEYVSPEVFS